MKEEGEEEEEEEKEEEEKKHSSSHIRMFDRWSRNKTDPGSKSNIILCITL